MFALCVYIEREREREKYANIQIEISKNFYSHGQRANTSI